MMDNYKRAIVRDEADSDHEGDGMLQRCKKEI